MARCKHYVEAFDCCAETSEWVDGLLCTDYCFYCNDEHPNCRYYEEKADVVEVKHGEWEFFANDSRTYTCSNCHITQTVNVFNGKVMFDYCPYCGAKMDLKGGADNGKVY